MSCRNHKVEAEYAKSGNSSCNKCLEPIENSGLRLGTKDARGYTKWHHLPCFSFGSESVASIDKIKGFHSLQTSDQEALKDKFEKSKKEDSNGKQSSQKRKVRKVDEAEAEAEAEDKNVGVKELKKKSKGGSSASTHVEAEYAKSGRSICKKCSEPIEKKTLRLGLVTKDPRGFDATKWHHLDCFSFGSESVASVDKIIGFQSLKSSDQEALKSLANEIEKPKEEVCEDEEGGNEVVQRKLKKAKIVLCG